MNLCLLPPTKRSAATKLAALLNHALPWLRQQAAEEMYDRAVGVAGLDEGEEARLLELLLETGWTEEMRRGEAEEVGRLVGRASRD